MVRGQLPGHLKPVCPVPIVFIDDQIAKIGKALGGTPISEDHLIQFKHIMGCYLATEDGITKTTKANVLRLLRDLNSKKKPVRDKALKCLASDDSAVDSSTHDLLAGLAFEVLLGQAGALIKLQEAAKRQHEIVVDGPQIKVVNEALRIFCGLIRVTFNSFAVGEARASLWHCRELAFCLFDVLNMDYKTYVDNPQRLDDLLGTVSKGLRIA